MAIIIGAATAVSFSGKCVISANWSMNLNTQRAYCIGEWAPKNELTVNKATRSLSITIYAPGPSYSTTPSISCSDANTIGASVSPVGCGGSAEGVGGSWFVNSYSYSKEDVTMPGQESWSLTQWTSDGGSIEPSFVLRGISEGQGTSNAGITFNGAVYETYAGSVSAGSFGKADVLRAGVVGSVGGGESSGGSTGQGSASMPYTPLYI